MTRDEATFAFAADPARCEAAAAGLLAGLKLKRRWSDWLTRRYADPALPYHGAVHIGLLWLRYLAHGGDADDVGMRLALLFHDAIYAPGACDNERLSADLVLRAAGPGAEAQWAAGAILATADHLGYQGGDLRVLRLLDLDLTPLAEDPVVFARNTEALRAEAVLQSERDWAVGRRRFISRLLAHDALYRSGLGDIYEARARRNLGRFRSGEPPL